MEKPNSLTTGNKVVIISTARKVSLEEITPAINSIKSWGLEVVFGNNLFKEHHQFAGTDEERAADLQAAMDDPDIKAVFCARGGYGTIKIIDKIDFTRFIEQPKWIVGFSDVTVLHAHINQNFNIQTLHAAMPVMYPSNTDESLLSLKKALFGEELQYKANGHQLNIQGKAEGVLVGGNLSILYSLTGTNSSLDTKGKILFMEDLDEYLYHADRMMMNLKRVGMLADLAGLIVGGMTKMNDNKNPYGYSVQEIIFDAVKEYGYPVCFDFPAGHIDNNKALIFGEKVKLCVKEGSAEVVFG